MVEYKKGLFVVFLFLFALLDITFVILFVVYLFICFSIYFFFVYSIDFFPQAFAFLWNLIVTRKIRLMQVFTTWFNEIILIHHRCIFKDITN